MSSNNPVLPGECTSSVLNVSRGEWCCLEKKRANMGIDPQRKPGNRGYDSCEYTWFIDSTNVTKTNLSHRAYYRKMSVLTYERSSTLSVHPTGCPVDPSMATHGSPSHPAAARPGLIIQAHGGSVWAACNTSFQLCKIPIAV